MSETQTLLEMTPASRMRRIEATRARIRRLIRAHGALSQEDKQLSTVAVAWLRRLETALMDEDCSEASFEEIQRAAFAAVPAGEADEFRRRLRSFAQFAEVCPVDARSVEESIEPVLEGLLRVADEYRARTSA